MPAQRLVPPVSELRRYVEQGLTHQQIADKIAEQTGVTLSRSTISAALSRAGLTVQRERYRDELPWRARAEHLTQYPARMLRLLGRRNAGASLTFDESDRLDSWLEALNDRDIVVAYVPDGDGFIYVDADEIHDKPNGIPIRKRLISLEELQ